MTEKIKTSCTTCRAEFNVPSGFLKKQVRCPKCREVFLVEESEILEIPPEETQVVAGLQKKFADQIEPKENESKPVRKSIAERYESRSSSGRGFCLENIFVLAFSAGAIVAQILPWRFIAPPGRNATTTSGLESTEGAMCFILTIFSILLTVASLFTANAQKLMKAATVFFPAIFFVEMISMSLLFIAGPVSLSQIVSTTYYINLNVGGIIALFITFLTIFFALTSKNDAVIKGLIGLFTVSSALLITNLVVALVGGKQLPNTSLGIGLFLNLGCSVVCAVFVVIQSIRTRILVWQQ